MGMLAWEGRAWPRSHEDEPGWPRLLKSTVSWFQMVFLFGAYLIAELVASSHLTDIETEFQQGGNLPKAVQEVGGGGGRLGGGPA